FSLVGQPMENNHSSIQVSLL
ncbi:hypothetical protein ABKN59_009865, partial [Abortiporus biennis]